MNQLANEYAYAAECQLATLDELATLKSSSKARIARQVSICIRMVRICQEYRSEIDWGQPSGREHYGRVSQVLARAWPPNNVKSAVNSYLAGVLPIVAKE